MLTPRLTFDNDKMLPCARLTARKGKPYLLANLTYKCWVSVGIEIVVKGPHTAAATSSLTAGTTTRA